MQVRATYADFSSGSMLQAKTPSPEHAACEAAVAEKLEGERLPQMAASHPWNCFD
jgi:hypothetical protein